MTNSCAFRAKVRSWDRKTFFTTLLADGAAAFYGFTGLDVGQNGPADTDGVDGAMGSRSGGLRWRRRRAASV